MKMAIHTLKVDPEFQGLIEPLEEDEWGRLEESLKAEGFLEDRGKILTWNETIVDGHHRYQICHQNNIPFMYTERDFPDRDAVKLWIINEQLGRRNLNPFQRSELVLKEKEVVVAEARERQQEAGKHGKEGGRGNIKTLGQNSDQGFSDPNEGRVAQKLADKANTSRDTIHKVAKLQEEADEETKQKLRSGEMTVNRAYKELKQKEQEGQPDHVNGSASKVDPFKSPRVKELVEGELVVGRILKIKTAEFTIQWTDGTKGTVSRQGLLKEDFCKCRSCNGFGVVPKQIPQTKNKGKKK